MKMIFHAMRSSLSRNLFVTDPAKRTGLDCGAEPLDRTVRFLSEVALNRVERIGQYLLIGVGQKLRCHRQQEVILFPNVVLVDLCQCM